MARVSKAKKVSLVYQELGSDARRGRDGILVVGDRPGEIGLGGFGKTEIISLPASTVEPVSDKIRCGEDEEARWSVTTMSSCERPNRLDGKRNSLSPILRSCRGLIRRRWSLCCV